MNKEIKIIDLLNMIAEGKEAPEKIKYNGKIYHIDDLEHFYVDNDRNALLVTIFDNYDDYGGLMEKIEIIEEDNNKIEYLEDFDFDYKLDTNEKCEILREWYQNLKRKQDEILDKLNNME